jgi:hypothetical protein
MINLSGLTSLELSLIDQALNIVDAALTLLLTHGAIDEDEGVDLLALDEAVAEEIDRRMMEDAQHKVAEALTRGEIVVVVRPDGQLGYQPKPPTYLQ